MPGRPQPLEPRLWAKVEKTETCWLWRGGKDGRGYGIIRAAGRLQKAHRVTYELLVGPIPEGMQIDHLCRVKGCVNPAHMEPVTGLVNTRRAYVGLVKRSKCPKGHPYTGDNLMNWGQTSGDQRCRTCERERYRRRYVRKRPPKAA